MRENTHIILVKMGLLLALLASYVLLIGLIMGPEASTPPSLKSHKKPYIHTSKSKSFSFPEGGRTLIPDYRFIALYGSPNLPELGTLGEQPLPEAIQRVKTLAYSYEPYINEHIYPTFEIIASVASSDPTENGDYSQPIALQELQPWVGEAKKQGVYVLLDLQPGRNDFLTQAKEFEPLLKEPHVGLALDPEWRLGPSEYHLQQVGHVSAAEVNQTATWLADITKKYKLPQKLFLLHQFQLLMIDNRELLDGSHSELSYLIQMDGHGDQQVKLDSWATIIASPPTNYNFGWKNFNDEDLPTRPQKETMDIVPTPWYVSYQ